MSTTNTAIDTLSALMNNIGINMEGGNTNTITNSNVVGTSQSDYGIRLKGTQGNTLLGNTVQTAKLAGILVESANNNDLVNTSVANVPQGNAISIRFSNGNDMIGNTLQTSSNGNGLRLEYSSQTKIQGNTLQNLARGILILSGSTANQVYQNNFINNPIQAQDFGSSNVWDINNEGNYWSDYQNQNQGCLDNNFNGICDAPKTFYFNQDNFPFTDQYGWINKWPIFTSTPVINATNGQLYTYDADAVDPDNDPVTYTLVQSPVNMTIDTSTGIIMWLAKYTTSYGPFTLRKPLVPSKISVTAKAADSHGAFRTQSWVITVQ